MIPEIPAYKSKTRLLKGKTLTIIQQLPAHPATGVSVTNDAVQTVDDGHMSGQEQRMYWVVVESLNICPSKQSTLTVVSLTLVSDALRIFTCALHNSAEIQIKSVKIYASGDSTS